MNKIYALGYGNWKKLQEFIKHLKMLGVGVLVDIRRFPTSKNQEFTRESLETELPKSGIRYEWMGEALGGFRRGGYQGHMKTREYETGIERLLETATGNNVAVMCVERRSKYCHRRFIMQTLSEMGAKVIPVEE